MKYDIYLSSLDRTKVLQLPVLPEQIPSLESSSKNEEFETFSYGSYNFIGAVGLLTFTLDSWLPSKGKNYSFQRIKNINPDDYIQFIDEQRLYKKPIRVVIARSDGTFIINNTFSVESFSWHENRQGDYEYSISFKQWRTL